MNKIGMLKRRFGIFCMVLLLLNINFFSVIAKEDEILFDLNSLGITSGFHVEEHLEEYVTRGEFCQIAVNMMGFDNTPLSVDTNDVFEDIEQHPYKDAIHLLYQLNIVSGSAEKTFSPDRYILYSEACKILVDILGYGAIIKERTLDAYTVMAANLGILKNVDRTEEFLTFKNLLFMVDNALDVEMMSYVLSTENVTSYEIIHGNTLRNALFSNNYRTITKMRGVVTADVSTYLNDKIPNLKINQLEIEGKVYDYDGIAPIGYVGQTVEFYFRSDNNNDGAIISIRPTDDNMVVDFSSDDIREISQNRIIFNDEKKYDDVLIDPLTKFVYNNRLDLHYNVQQLLNKENVFAKAIDNDDDGIAEVMFIEEYVNCIVERVYAEENKVYFKNSTLYKGSRYLDLDTNDKDVYVELLGSDLKPVDFSEIKEGSILSIAGSKDGDALKVILSDSVVTGILEEISEDTITVDGSVYRRQSDLIDLKIGKTVTAYINFYDTVFYVEYPLTENNYAYVYQIHRSTSLSDGYQVKLLIPGKISVKYDETENEDGGETIKTPKLFCRNSDVVVYSVSDKVKVNGVSIDINKLPSYILNKPIAYTLDDSGKITKIDILEPVGEGTSKYYNSYEMTFGKTAGKAFGIAENTTSSICVPVNENVSDDDLKVFIELLNGVKYDVQGYVLNEDTQIVDLVVMQAELRAGQPGIVTASSDVAMVTKVANTYSEDENTNLIKVSMIVDGKETEYTVSTLIPSPESFLSLKRGDLIAYSLDGFDNLNGFELLQSVDNYYDFLMNRYSEKEKFCGEVKNIIYNYVSNIKNRWVHGLEVGFGSDNTVLATYEVFKRGKTPVFIIHENKKISTGTFDDIQIGDRIFVTLNVDIPRAIVIKR